MATTHTHGASLRPGEELRLSMPLIVRIGFIKQTFDVEVTVRLDAIRDGTADLNVTVPAPGETASGR